MQVDALSKKLAELGQEPKAMREIVLDTETTGLDPLQGHRIVEIGAVELFNHIPTGNTYHTFINPQRDVPREAEAVHGLSSEFLKDKPVFSQIADEFLEFIGETVLIIHNASFDVGFLNAELGFIKRPPILYERIIDTLTLAKKRHPMGPNSLDALCKRYGIDIAKRTNTAPCWTRNFLPASILNSLAAVKLP